MLDCLFPMATIKSTRREDRAMLRSNPSARAGAEAWWGVSRHGTRPPALQPTSCFGSNAINLNPRYRAKTPLYWLAVRHMSGSPRLTPRQCRGVPSLGETRPRGSGVDTYLLLAILRPCSG